MNFSVQQEIAAPKDCNNKLRYLIIALAEVFIMAIIITVISLKYSGKLDNKYLTPMLFIGIIVAIGIIAAVLLRKHLIPTIVVLILASLNSEVLLILHYVMTTSGMFAIIRQVITIFLSFAIIYFTLILLAYYNYKPRERNPQAMRNTKYLTYCAMFTALAVICKMIGNAVSNSIPIAGTTIKFTAVYIPWVIGGIVLGPIGGFAAAAIGDLLGQLVVSTGGAPFPELTLANGMFAVFPAIIYKVFRSDNLAERATISILLGTVISAIICTMGISTYSLYSRIFFDSYSYSEYMLIRTVQLFVIIANMIIMIPIALALIRAKVIKQPLTHMFD